MLTAEEMAIPPLVYCYLTIIIIIIIIILINIKPITFSVYPWKERPTKQVKHSTVNFVCSLKSFWVNIKAKVYLLRAQALLFWLWGPKAPILRPRTLESKNTFGALTMEQNKKSLHGWCQLRSTKWNASLIFACDTAELVSLCKVMFWKTHIPVRTQKMATPLNFCKGTSRHSY